MIDYIIDNYSEIGKIEVYAVDKNDKALNVFG